MIVLSLCDLSAVAVRDWKVFGDHTCICVDIAYEEDYVDELGIIRLKRDVLKWKPDFVPDWVFAFPPCTHLAASGAKYWERKGLPPLIKSLRLFSACEEICKSATFGGYIENPIGRISTIYRPPDE